MKTSLLLNLTDDQKREVNQSYISGSAFRKQLIATIDKKIERLRADMENDDLFTTDNWEYVQVDRLAQIKAMKAILTLIE